MLLIEFCLLGIASKLSQQILEILHMLTALCSSLLDFHGDLHFTWDPCDNFPVTFKLFDIYLQLWINIW